MKIADSIVNLKLLLSYIIHNTKWQWKSRVYKFEGVLLSMDCSIYETNILCYDENEETGLNGPAMTDYGTTISIDRSLRLPGIAECIKLDESSKSHKAFLDDLFAVEANGDVIFPLDIYAQISDYRLKRNIRNITK